MQRMMIRTICVLLILAQIPDLHLQAQEETATPAQVPSSSAITSEEPVNNERIAKQQLVASFDREIANAKEEHGIDYSAYQVVKSCYGEGATVESCRIEIETARVDLSRQIEQKAAATKLAEEERSAREQNLTIVNIDQSEYYDRFHPHWRRTPTQRPVPTQWEPGALPKPSWKGTPKTQMPRKSERPVNSP